MWEYIELPEALRLPACPHCRNRGGVTRVADCLYACTDCQPVRLFAAVWRTEKRVELAERPARERVG